MEENDFKRLENIMEQRDRKLREEISGDTQRKVEVLRQEINEDFKHHVGILTEDYRIGTRCTIKSKPRH